MKKFKFRLRTVLHYRTLLKKETERELARKNFELVSAEQRLREIRLEQEKSRLNFSQEQTMADFGIKTQYEKRLHKAIDSQQLLILEAEQAVEQARDAYIEKSVDAKALESVRDKKREEFKKEISHQEREEMDEMVVQRYRFNSAKVQKEDE